MQYKLIMENWRKVIKEGAIHKDAFSLSGMTDTMYQDLDRKHGQDLKQLGLSIEDYKRFSGVFSKRGRGFIPIERFIQNMKDPNLKQKMIQIDPGLDKTTKDFPSDGMNPSTYDGSTHAGGKEQQFSGAPSKQRVEKMYNALKQMDGQLVGAKYESALAAMNELLRELIKNEGP